MKNLIYIFMVLLFPMLLKSQVLPTKTDVIATMQKVNDYWINTNPSPGNNQWARSVYFTGDMAFYKVYQEQQYLDYANLWATNNNWTLNGGIYTRNADNQCAGQTYIALYELDVPSQPNKIANITTCINNMVNSGQITDWSWIDALYMAMPVFTKLGVVHNDTNYFAKMYQLYSDNKIRRHLFNSSKGLWYRDSSYIPPYKTPNGLDCIWSRGNGWVIAAHAKVLESLPVNNSHRNEYISTLQSMANALKNVQRADGLWNVSLADTNYYPGPETSGTSFFTFAIAWGINNGFLDSATYTPVITKAWNGLVSIAVHTDGFLGYVQGNANGPADSQPVTYQTTSDFGVGAFLLAGSEVVKLASGNMPVPPGSDTQAPSVPTGLASNSITQTSFTLSWTASTDNVGVTGYEVFKNGASIGTSASASMSVTGLTASTTYSMTVRARDAVPNWSAQSTVLNVTTSASGSDTQAPSVPTGLASSSITQTSFTLNWTASTDNVGVTGYDVYKNTVLETSVTGISASITGLTASTTYSMTVKAKDVGGNTSAASTALNVTTSANGGSVTSSTTWQSFTRSTQTGTFTAAFDAVPNTANMNGVTGIQNGTATDYTNLACAARFYTTGRIQAINGGDGVYSSSTTVNYSAGTSYHFRFVINVTAHTYSIYVTPNGQGEVTLGTNYAFRSQQAGVTQLTGWSLVAPTGTHTVSNMTFTTAGDTQAPSVPTGLTSSSITQTSFTLSWTASTDNVGVTGYEVFKNGASIGTSASASMSVTGLTASTTYSMTVRARDAVPNWSAQSTALNITTSAGSDTQAPSVPTGLTSSSITQTSFTLNWTASTDNVGVTGYEVFKNGASIGTSASASMSVTGLTASTTYSMTVRARDAVPNWSAQSTVLNVTTSASGSDTQAPSVPTGLASSSITQTSFTLNWTASTDNVGVTGYEVFKNGASIGTSASASMSVTGLTASTTYSMTVRARDAVPNWSAQSTALNVTTSANGGSVTSSTTWQSFTVSTQTGTFTAAFDAVPNTANMNGVTGIQNGTATDYTNLACAARFYTTGRIQAINGGDGVYSSSTTVNYTAGTSYHFRLVINVTAHTYSIYVTPNGQGEVTLGTNYAFRSQQAGVTQLTGWSLVAPTGTHTVSNMTFGSSGKISQAPNNESESGNNADAMPSKPVTFSLSQNYPNPFNPTTNIEYRIANSGFVSLKIYDVLGREVSTLVNGQKSIGIYTVQWDASNLPSGVYFSRLTVQTQEGMPIVMTKKILFTK